MKDSTVKSIWIGILWMVLIELLSCGLALAFEEEDTSLLLPENPLKGSQTFFDKGCIHCHQILGMGEAFGPDLTATGKKWGFFGLAGAMWSHSPRMIDVMEDKDIPRPVLSPQEVEHLLAYLYYLSFFDELGDYREGEKLFEIKGCATCHSLGRGKERSKVSLDKYGRYASPVFIVTALWNHSSTVSRAMTGITFAPREMSNIIAYIQGEASNRGGEKIYMRPGNPRNGEEIFRNKGCMTCHGAGGLDLKKSPLRRSLTEIVGMMWSHSYKMWEAMRTKGLKVPHFSDQDMADLVSYLYFLNYFDGKGDAKKGEKVFQEKGCAACHGQEDTKENRGGDLKEAESASIFSLISLMWNHIPEMEKMIEDYNLVWPQFDEDEMNDLIRFIQSVK
jgi:mono/diheme cytochrome c family protein